MVISPLVGSEMINSVVPAASPVLAIVAEAAAPGGRDHPSVERHRMVVVEQEPFRHSLGQHHSRSIWDVRDPAVVQHPQMRKLSGSEISARRAVGSAHFRDCAPKSWGARPVQLPAGEQCGALLRASEPTQLSRRHLEEVLRQHITAA